MDRLQSYTHRIINDMDFQNFLPCLILGTYERLGDYPYKSLFS